MLGPLQWMFTKWQKQFNTNKRMILDRSLALTWCSLKKTELELGMYRYL